MVQGVTSPCTTKTNNMDDNTITGIITTLTTTLQYYSVEVTYSPSYKVNGQTACECFKVAIDANELTNRKIIEGLLTKACTQWNMNVYDDPDSDMGFMIF